MRVLSRCSALLSDYEVLALLRDLEAEQAAAYRARKGKAPEYQLSLRDEEHMLKALPQNLREAQFETMATLNERFRGSAHQSAAHITAFLGALQSAGFTGPRGPDGNRRAILSKAEQLQILNHVPTSAVELFALIDGFLERFEDHMEPLLQLIKDHLPQPLSPSRALELAEQERRAELEEQEQQEEEEESGRRSGGKEKKGKSSVVIAGDDDMDEDMNAALASSSSRSRSTAKTAAAQQEEVEAADEGLIKPGEDLIHEERGEAIDDEEKPQE